MEDSIIFFNNLMCVAIYLYFIKSIAVNHKLYQRMEQDSSQKKGNMVVCCVMVGREPEMLRHSLRTKEL